MTREVIGLQLDKSKIGEGQLGVDWTILEQGDGAVLQLLYYGDDQTLITASATVEQQGDVRELGHDQEWLMTWIMSIAMIGALPGIIFILSRRILTSKRFYKVIMGIQIGSIILMIIVAIYHWGWVKPNPPVNVTGF